MKIHCKQSTLYIITLCLACCSLMYELLIAQAISFFATNAVVWYSLTIGLYLVSLGIGAMHCHRIFPQKDLCVQNLWKVELWLSFFGFISVISLHLAHMMMGSLWINEFYLLSIILFYSVGFILIIIIGFLSGLEVPLLIALGKHISPSKNIVNRILAVDYFGSLCAGLIFPLFLVPHWELIDISFMIALINFCVAGYLFLVAAKSQSKSFSWISRFFALKGEIFFIVFIVICVGNVKAINQYFLKKYYYYQITGEHFSTLFKGMKKFPPVEREISSYQKLDLVRLLPTLDNLLGQKIISAYKKKTRDDSWEYKNYALFINGSFQFYAMTEMFYHEYFAHVPVIIHGEVPQKVLVLGAGDGLLVRELLKYKEIEEITLVEIDPQMIQWARTHPILRAINKGALDSPRVSVLTQDAYSFVRTHSEKYDAIYLDFPQPTDYNLSKIYSREFYQSVYSLLNTKGYLVFDAPEEKIFQGVAESKLSAGASRYLQTLKKAGYAFFVSFETELEKTNRQARKVFRDAIGSATELKAKVKDVSGERIVTIKGKEKIVDKLLMDFIEDHKQRFILAKKHAQVEDLSYIDFGLDFNVLNEQRYQLSIDYFSQGENSFLNNSESNSIIRPTLPDPRFWWRLKFPY